MPMNQIIETTHARTEPPEVGERRAMRPTPIAVPSWFRCVRTMEIHAAGFGQRTVAHWVRETR